jgi:hypothetical protein
MNKLLIQLMMECRQKNLIVFIVMPTFFMLEKYVAVFRATGLFHVYRNKKGQRGFWMYFNYNTKKKLYDYGMKRYYSYKWPGSNFKGKFTNKYLLNEAEYRKKKGNSLRESFDDNKFDKKDWQRNFMFWYLNDKKGMSTREISEELTAYGFKIGHTGVYTAIQKFIDFKERN